MNLQSQKEAQADSGQQAVDTASLMLLSSLYKLLCNCRKNYEELDQLLHPDFHLEDCNYAITLEKNGITIETLC